MDTSSIKYQADAVMKDFYGENTPGAVLLVIKEAKIIIEKGYGLANLATKDNITPSTNFRMASVSKQFTAMSVLLLAEKQKLSLHNSLNDFFSGLPVALQSIAIEQLLAHSSGIGDYEVLISPGQIRQVLDEDVLQLIKQKGSAYFSPGTKFKYSNTGYCLLALAVEQVSGLSFADFVKENIFDPLRMEHSIIYEKKADIPHRAYGYHPDGDEYHLADQDITSATKGDGGVYTSLNDYRKWYEALGNNVLLSKEWTDKIFSKQAIVEDNVGYGYGWFIGKEKEDAVCRFHSGESTGFHNMVYSNAEKDLLIAIFSNRDDNAVAQAFDQVTGLLDIQTVFPHKNNLLLVQWLSDVYGR